jgi:ssDNA-binding Zn-finger/Zn-ribbon topoisomerase 1
MKRDTDYGRVPGTTKDTLFKPGAEKLTNFFGLSPTFDVIESELDWTGQNHGGEAFFYYQYRCTLYHAGVAVGQGVGSCNSWEKKYRYRKAGHVCPDCGESAIIKGKQEYGGGWLCYRNKGGCGHKWADGSAQAQEFVNVKPGAVKNDNPADQVNTIDKMAQKRALVAAVLIAVNASEFFTQDIEDMPDIVDGSYEPVTPPHSGNGQPPEPPREDAFPLDPNPLEVEEIIDDEIDHVTAALEAPDLKVFAEHAWQGLDGYTSPEHVVGTFTRQWPEEHGQTTFRYTPSMTANYLQWLADRKAQEAA